MDGQRGSIGFAPTGFDPVTDIVEIPQRLVASLACLTEAHAAANHYASAKKVYAILIDQAMALSHDETVGLINRIGCDNRPAAHVASAWTKARGLHHPILEFETAGVMGGSTGEMMAYRRRGKSAWGKLLTVTDGEPRTSRYLEYWVKENNPILWRHRTRNEMKIALGPGKAHIVNLAVRWNKRDFLYRFRDAEQLIREKLAMSPEEFWRVAREGDKKLVEQLGKLPSPLRERMRQRGMQVAPKIERRIDEQLSLFEQL